MPKIKDFKIFLKKYYIKNLILEFLLVIKLLSSFFAIFQLNIKLLLLLPSL